MSYKYPPGGGNHHLLHDIGALVWPPGVDQVDRSGIGALIPPVINTPGGPSSLTASGYVSTGLLPAFPKPTSSDIDPTETIITPKVSMFYDYKLVGTYNLPAPLNTELAVGAYHSSSECRGRFASPKFVSLGDSTFMWATSTKTVITKNFTEFTTNLPASSSNLYNHPRFGYNTYFGAGHFPIYVNGYLYIVDRYYNSLMLTLFISDDFGKYWYQINQIALDTNFGTLVNGAPYIMTYLPALNSLFLYISVVNAVGGQADGYVQYKLKANGLVDSVVKGYRGIGTTATFSPHVTSWEQTPTHSLFSVWEGGLHTIVRGNSPTLSITPSAQGSYKGNQLSGRIGKTGTWTVGDYYYSTNNFQVTYDGFTIYSAAYPVNSVLWAASKMGGFAVGDSIVVSETGYNAPGNTYSIITIFPEGNMSYLRGQQIPFDFSTVVNDFNELHWSVEDSESRDIYACVGSTIHHYSLYNSFKRNPNNTIGALSINNSSILPVHLATILLNILADGKTLTLPDTAAYQGSSLTLKNNPTSSYNVTITQNNGDSGLSNITLLPGDSIELLPTLGSWSVKYKLQNSQKVVSGSYDVLKTDQDLFVDTSSSSATLQFLSTTILRSSHVFTIKDKSGNAANNNITITTEGSETIDGQNSLVINTNYGKVNLISDGSNLYKV